MADSGGSDNEQDIWKKQFDNIDQKKYKKIVEDIVKRAREKTNAEVGVLFLTADGIFLEAAHWERESLDRPPAAELPTYRLNWWEENNKALDGITAYVAIRRKIENLNQQEVFEHPAWKGKWDAVFLEGERTKCKGILAIPLQNEIGAETHKARVHGVLKVENPNTPDSFGRFKNEHQKSLTEFARAIAGEMDKSSDFWQNFVQARADLKVSHMVELLERGRSIRYNLSQSLGYVIKLFATWLGCNGAVHVFWRDGKSLRCHVLHLWDCAKGDQAEAHEELKDKEIAGKLVDWFKGRVGPKVIQPGFSINSELWSFLFTNISHVPHEKIVDIIRLKAGRYDLGVLILPRSPLWETDDYQSDIDRQILETLTRLAMNTVSILGRFIEDEYETSIDTYLPEHRPPRALKVCGILFADIRNFSQLTQILRMMGKQQLIELFLDHYCARMGKVIGETPLGRVDKFHGDGVMAIFGEYLDDGDRNYEKVVAAVYCACKMLEEFRNLYKRWLEEGLDREDISYGLWQTECTSGEGVKSEPFQDLRKQFNEDVQIDLGVGINLGEVIFDYFGDRTHREYTVIGDHVNYTDRLQDAAGRYDEKEHRKRANILVSQIVYQFLHDHGYLLKILNPFWLRFEGLGFAYPVYEIEYADLNHEKIAETMRNLEYL